MAKAIKKKAAKKAVKKRASTYDAKLAINGTFEDVIAVSVAGVTAKKKEIKNADNNTLND